MVGPIALRLRLLGAPNSTLHIANILVLLYISFVFYHESVIFAIGLIEKSQRKYLSPHNKLLSPTVVYYKITRYNDFLMDETRNHILGSTSAVTEAFETRFRVWREVKISC